MSERPPSIEQRIDCLKHLHRKEAAYRAALVGRGQLASAGRVNRNLQILDHMIRDLEQQQGAQA